MRTKLLAMACKSKTQPVVLVRSVFRYCLLCCIGALIGGCDRASIAPASVELRGGGSTFPAPLYDRWFGHMMEQHPDLTIDYEKIGSGSGVRQFIDELVDFAASDDPLTNQQIAQVDRGVCQVPMTSGAIVLSYNLRDAEGHSVSDLKLSRKAYVEIFLGKIRSWNDDEIARHNPHVMFPDLPIQVEYRLDSSGTTSALTRHLSKISEAWGNGPGVGKTVQWPVGAGMPKNSGMARGLKQVPGSIGYLSYAFAKQEGLPMAILENREGNFVAPDLHTIQLGLSGLVGNDSDPTTYLPDPGGHDAYPIVTYSWILCYRVYQDPSKLAMLKKLVSYGLQDGQQFSAELGYVALLDGVSQDALAVLDSITLPRSADTATSIPVSDSPSLPGTIGAVVAEVVEEVSAVGEDANQREVDEKDPPEKSADVQTDDVSVEEAAAKDEQNAAHEEQRELDSASDDDVSTDQGAGVP